MTGDTHDVEIVDGIPMWLITAYHSSDGSGTTYPKHDHLPGNVYADFTLVPDSPPGAASGLKLAGATVNQISLSWTIPSQQGGSNVTGYNIYRSTSSAGTFAQVAERQG